VIANQWSVRGSQLQHGPMARLHQATSVPRSGERADHYAVIHATLKYRVVAGCVLSQTEP
jgi:hypothetical protein